MKNLLIVIAVLVFIGLLGGCSYNGMVQKDENVKSKWGEVQTQYQRRSDLIPNLVSTVKGEAKFEQSTLTAVVEARAKATSVQIDANSLTPENVQKFQQAQGQLHSALSRLLVTVEKYPDLKTNDSFKQLSAQIEGTENRIGFARKDFNDAVQDYNSKIRAFPSNIIAGMAGFKEKGYFAAEEGADKAPKVEF